MVVGADQEQTGVNLSTIVVPFQTNQSSVTCLPTITWSFSPYVMSLISGLVARSSTTIHGRDVQNFRKSEFESSKQEILP